MKLALKIDVDTYRGIEDGAATHSMALAEAMLPMID